MLADMPYSSLEPLLLSTSISTSNVIIPLVSSETADISIILPVRVSSG